MTVLILYFLELYIMALWSNGGTTYPDVLFTLGLLICALTGLYLNSLALYRNYKKPASVARALYLLLQIVDLATSVFLCPSLAYTISTLKDPGCFDDEQDETLKFFKNCTTNYISYGIMHPSTFKRAWTVFCFWFAYSPCILTGMLAMTRYYQIKYPFRHVSKRLVVGIAVAASVWQPVWYADMIREKGDDDQAMFIIVTQQVFITITKPKYVVFGIPMSLGAFGFSTNLVSITFQGFALIASVMTVRELMKINSVVLKLRGEKNYKLQWLEVIQSDPDLPEPRFTGTPIYREDKFPRYGRSPSPEHPVTPRFTGENLYHEHSKQYFNLLYI
eukprot:sb/3466623/